MQGTGKLRTGSRLDELAEALPGRASTLSRLVISRTSVPLSRTEAAVLLALTNGPMRISELAKRERVTQPGISLLVNRLEARGWVKRDADPNDRRVVLVSITPDGRGALDELRAEYRALLHEEMASLSPEEVETLWGAVEILDRLLVRLQQVDA